MKSNSLVSGLFTNMHCLIVVIIVTFNSKIITSLHISGDVTTTKNHSQVTKIYSRSKYYMNFTLL